MAKKKERHNSQNRNDEQLKEELLKKIKEEEEKEKKKAEKKAFERKKVETLKQESLIEQAAYLLKTENKKICVSTKNDVDSKTKVSKVNETIAPTDMAYVSESNYDDMWDEDHADSGSKNYRNVNDKDEMWVEENQASADDMWDDNPNQEFKTNDVISSKSSSNAKNECYDEIWDEEYVGTKTSFKDELWNDAEDNVCYQNQKTYHNGKKYQESSAASDNRPRRLNSGSGYAENRKNVQQNQRNYKRTKNSQTSKNSSRYDRNSETKIETKFIWDIPEKDFNKAGVVEAPEPEVNIWEERKAKMETLEELLPHNDREEEAMLRQALELSRREAREEERRRREIEEEYEMQMKMLMSNPNMFEADALGDSGTLENEDMYPQLKSSPSSESSWLQHEGIQSSYYNGAKPKYKVSTDNSNQSWNCSDFTDNTRDNHITQDRFDLPLIESDFPEYQFDEINSHLRSGSTKNKCISSSSDFSGLGTKRNNSDKKPSTFSNNVKSRDSISDFQRSDVISKCEKQPQLPTSGVTNIDQLWNNESYHAGTYSENWDGDNEYDDVEKKFSALSVHKNESISGKKSCIDSSKNMFASNEVSVNDTEKSINNFVRDNDFNENFSHINYESSLKVNKESVGEAYTDSNAEINWEDDDKKEDCSQHFILPINKENDFEIPKSLHDVKESTHLVQSLGDQNCSSFSHTFSVDISANDISAASDSAIKDMSAVEEWIASSTKSHKVSRHYDADEDIFNVSSRNEEPKVSVADVVSLPSSSVTDIEEKVHANQNHSMETEFSHILNKQEDKIKVPHEQDCQNYKISNETTEVDDEKSNQVPASQSSEIDPSMFSKPMPTLQACNPVDPSFLLSSGLPLNSGMVSPLLYQQMLMQNTFFMQQLYALQMYYASLGTPVLPNMLPIPGMMQSGVPYQNNVMNFTFNSLSTQFENPASIPVIENAVANDVSSSSPLSHAFFENDHFTQAAVPVIENKVNQTESDRCENEIPILQREEVIGQSNFIEHSSSNFHEEFNPDHKFPNPPVDFFGNKLENMNTMSSLTPSEVEFQLHRQPRHGVDDIYPFLLQAGSQNDIHTSFETEQKQRESQLLYEDQFVCPVPSESDYQKSNAVPETNQPALDFFASEGFEANESSKSEVIGWGNMRTRPKQKNNHSGWSGSDEDESCTSKILPSTRKQHSLSKEKYKWDDDVSLNQPSRFTNEYRIASIASQSKDQDSSVACRNQTRANIGRSFRGRMRQNMKSVNC